MIDEIKKEIEDINFDDVDYSKYSKEINEIKLLVKELKRSPILRLKLWLWRKKHNKQVSIVERVDKE